MFFPFPIRTEKETIKLPYLTMGLIFLNIAIWLFTNRIVTQEHQELTAIQSRMFEIEDEYIGRVMRDDPQYLYRHSPVELHERFEKDVVRRSFGGYEEWTALYGEYKARSANTFFHRWGFIPDRFSFLKLLCSIFIHAGFFHVFGNMLFLWCVGCNLEDDWGWGGFLASYILAGIAAGGLHALKAPESTIPCVGASGAIAGIMGIFLVKYYKIKIKFFYLWLLRFWKPWGYFTTYAGVVIPIWFIQQLIGAGSSTQDGVGYWAHIGGFIFGAIAAGTIKLIGLDDGPILTGVQPISGKARFQIDPKTPLVQQAKRALQDDPANVQKVLFYARAFVSRGQEKNAAILYNMGLDLILKSKDSNLMVSAFHEISTNGMLDRLTEKNLYLLGVGLEHTGNYQEAVSLFVLYANRFQEGKAREKSLYRAYVLLRDSIRDDASARMALAFLEREYPDTILTRQPAPPVEPALSPEVRPLPQPVNELFVPA
jgi:membrane associated rhomboid family serine protease